MAGLALRTTALLAVFVALEVSLMRLTRLPQESYTRVVSLSGLFDRLVSAGPLGAIALLAIGAALVVGVRSPSIRAGWNSLENGAALRAVVGTTAVALAWAFATYPHNAYFGQPHHLERLLALVLAALVFRRPVFVFALLPLLLSVGWQFHHPLGGFSWAPTILPIRVLILFGAFWVLRSMSARVQNADFIFLLFSLVCAHYWTSGIGKLRLGWLGDDSVGLLLPATYTNGWLGFLSNETISTITRALLFFNWPMKLATLLVECGALLALWRRATLRALLAAAFSLHAAIFLLTGIFFWMWMLLAALLFALLLPARGPAAPVFTRSHFLLSLALIAAGGLWFRSVRLAWLDSAVSYTYRLEAEDANGRRQELPPAFFSPYRYQFALSAFRYLVPEPRLAVTWGAAPREVIRALMDAREPQDVFDAEQAIGRNGFDPHRAATFDDFVRRFVTIRDARGKQLEWWRLIPAPPFIWTFPLRARPELDAPERVVVTEITSFFDGEHYLQIRRMQVRVIDLFPTDRGRTEP